jgi:hypothetical protein
MFFADSEIRGVTILLLSLKGTVSRVFFTSDTFHESYTPGGHLKSKIPRTLSLLYVHSKHNLNYILIENEVQYHLAYIFVRHLIKSHPVYVHWYVIVHGESPDK